MRGRDPNDSERFTVRPDGGRKVRALSQNFENVRGPKLFRCRFGDFSDAY
jgi:hypothetical protein